MEEATSQGSWVRKTPHKDLEVLFGHIKKTCFLDFTTVSTITFDGRIEHILRRYELGLAGIAVAEISLITWEAREKPTEVDRANNRGCSANLD